MCLDKRQLPSQHNYAQGHGAPAFLILPLPLVRGLGQAVSRKRSPTRVPSLARRLVAASSIASPATPSPTAPAAAAAVLPRPGFVDRKYAAVVLGFVQSGDRRLCLGIGRHFHETEAFAATGVPVRNNLRALNGTEWRKQLLQIGALDVIGQISAIQSPSHRGSPVRGNGGPTFSFPGRRERG